MGTLIHVVMFGTVLAAGVKPHLVRYKRAFCVFFAAILALTFTIPHLKNA